MILTLSITILTESLVVLGYCFWRQKPIQSIWLTSSGANLITQLMLWGLVNLFFQHYLVALLVTEIFIWLIEAIALYSIPANRLQFKDALLLSLSMNLVSFTLGCFLPI